MIVSRDGGEFSRIDLGLAARHQVGQHAPGAAGHGPAERAVAGVEIEVGVAVSRRSPAGRPASSAAGRTRTWPRPRSPPRGNRSLTECSSVRRRAACSVRSIAGELGRAADADAVAEPGDRHLVGLVHHGRFRRAVGIGDRHGDRVALDRIDRDARCRAAAAAAANSCPAPPHRRRPATLPASGGDAGDPGRRRRSAARSCVP